jgi:hypothetical protein
MGIGESLVGMVRAVILAMIAASCLVLFMNLAFFFPWYLTLVEKGFVVSQMVATDNCLRYVYNDDLLTELRDYPIFHDVDPDKIKIVADHLFEDGTYRETAIQDVNKDLADYYDINECDCPIERDELTYCQHRPYAQMGGRVRVTISAPYRLQMKLFGKDIHEFGDIGDFGDIHMSFSINTTTTKHYKDLYYEYVFDDAYVISPVEQNEWFDWGDPD